MAKGRELNRDYERRPYWQATMPAQPDRSGRDLPGHRGRRRDRRRLRGDQRRAGARPARGRKVTLLEAQTLGWGGSTRNGGIVHAGYKWSPRT